MQALWMLVAAVCFGTMSLFIKLAAAHASLPDIILARGLVPALGICAWAIASGHSLKTPVFKIHLRRNLAGITAMWCGFYGTTQLPLATATTLMYTSPLFIALYLWVLYKQTHYLQEKLAIAIGFAGVVAVLQPVIGQGQEFAAFIGLSAGAIAAVAYLQLKSLGQANEPEWRTVMYFAFTAVISALLLKWTTPLGINPKNLNSETLIYLAGVGAFGGAGNLALTRSFGSGSTWLSAALQYTTILVSTLYGILVFGNHPEANTWLGVVLILICGFVSSYATQVRKKETKTTT